MSTKASRRHDPARGFSLAEVVVAMGLLAGVLIAVAGLFALGGRQVRSGGAQSEALAVGRAIQEELVGWGYPRLWRGFGFDGRAARYVVDTRSCAACGAWQSALSESLGQGAYGSIELESVPTVGGSSSTFADAAGDPVAKAVRVGVTIHWVEVPMRARSLTLGTTRN